MSHLEVTSEQWNFINTYAQASIRTCDFISVLEIKARGAEMLDALKKKLEISKLWIGRKKRKLMLSY